MKKKYIFISFISIVSFVGIGMMLSNRDKTRHYHGISQAIPSTRCDNPRCKAVNFDGFSGLKPHGSGVINFHDFKKHFPYDTNKLYVINLLEDDIYYYNNRCLSWYGLESTSAELGKVMEEKPYRKFGKFFVRLVYGHPPTYDPAKLQTEAEIFRAMGAHYYVPLRGNTNWLADQSFIDEIIQIFDEIPEDGHLYIHCNNGRGRTATFLILYDIFKNAKKMSLNDIVDRHFCLGREDLYNTTVWRAGNWTKEALEARKALVKNFYAYMSSAQGYPHKTWVQWNASQPPGPQYIQIHR